MSAIRLTIFLILSASLSCLYADIKGRSQINFDVNSDGSLEASLERSGLTLNGNLNIGSSSQASELHLNGVFHQSFQTYSANATLGVNAFALVDTSSDNIWITLPYAGNVSGRIYTIKKTSDQNKIWVSGGGNQIDASEPLELDQFDHVKVLSDGRQWHIVESNQQLQTVGADNLVAYWHFDSASGTTLNDYSVNEHTGIAYLMNSDNISTPALISNGMDFDGVNDYIEIENSAELRGMSQLSITSWVYIHSKQNYAAIVAKTDNNASNSNRTYRMQYDNSADQKFRFHLFTDVNTSGISIVSNNAAPLNQWVFLVMLYDGSNSKIYVDTVLQSNQGNLSGNLADFSNARNTISIGHQQYNLNNNNAFDGLIDEVRIYNKALSDEEIRVLFQQGQ